MKFLIVLLLIAIAHRLIRVLSKVMLTTLLMIKMAEFKTQMVPGGLIPSPYKEGTPEYDQWHASVTESIRSANNEPELQLGPEPRANNTNQ